MCMIIGMLRFWHLAWIRRKDHFDACKTGEHSNAIFLCWLLAQCSGIKSPLFPPPLSPYSALYVWGQHSILIVGGENGRNAASTRDFGHGHNHTDPP